MQAAYTPHCVFCVCVCVCFVFVGLFIFCFWIEKYVQEYVNNSFYVTGESYGGVYVPTLVHRILVGNQNNEGTNINLKAFAIG